MIITRFAPSNTGYLHIGGARTALFNYLYARHNQGKFLLRIEDTDKTRINEDASKAIVESMRWLGLDWDGETIYQSNNIERHKEIVDHLLKEGHAYRCYMSEEELVSQRENNRHHFKAFRSPWRDRTEADHVFNMTRPYVVRIKMPESGSTTIRDLVQGSVVVQHETLDDYILLRSDGTPTYMLAAVADDHDMGITHVIRGDDHLNNAFRQLPIYRFMGWNEPIYAHVPLIHNAEGKKYSKRDGAASVGDYEKDFLPDALFNYLLRLGWGHGNEEIISREQAVEWFDVIDVNRAPARMDEKKLLNLNGHYIHNSPDEHLLNLLKTSRPDLVKKAMPELKKRAKTLTELREISDFLEGRMFVPAIHPLAGEISDLLDGLNWDHDILNNVLRQYALDKQMKFKDVAAIIRTACTGKEHSIGVIDILTVLGREESLARLREETPESVCT